MSRLIGFRHLGSVTLMALPLLAGCPTSGEITPPGDPDGSPPDQGDGAVPGGDATDPTGDAAAPPDAPNPPDAAVPIEVAVCDDGQAPYATLAAAIAGANDGAILEVCPGTYAEAVDIMNKHLTIRGTGGAAVTIVDGGGAGTVIHVRDTAGTGVILQGLTVRGGSAGLGAGIRCQNSTLIVRDSVVTANEGGSLGGGLHTAGCALELDTVVVQGNTAGNGGGLYSDEGMVTIKNSEIRQNTARTRGGGLYLSSNALVQDSTIADNRADWTGGGVFVWEHAAQFLGNIITGNSSENDGGGMYFHWGTPTINDNRIEGNLTNDDGAGIRLFTSTGVVERNIIQNNVAGDSGGGIRVSHLPCQFKDNTIRFNHAVTGGGVDFDNDSSVMTGGVISNNTADRGAGMHIFMWPWADGRIEDVKIADNESYNGGAISMRENFQVVTLHRLTIAGNRAARGAAIYARRTNWRLTNSLVADNEATLQGGVLNVAHEEVWTKPCPCPPTNQPGKVSFVVGYGNSAPNGSVLWKDSADALTIENSIFFDNVGPTTVQVIAEEPTPENPFPPVVPPSWRYNDTMPAGGWEGMGDPGGSDGNISANPMFVNPGMGNFHLSASSPCKNAGDPALSDPDNSRADMGMFGGPAAP